MSIHRSLASQGKLIRHRNVLRRSERLQALLGEERWKPSDGPFGLPKYRSIKHKAKKAKKKEEAAVVAGAPGTAPAEAPAAKSAAQPKAAPGKPAAAPAAKPPKK